jgi:hypothetical protein
MHSSARPNEVREQSGRRRARDLLADRSGPISQARDRLCRIREKAPTIIDNGGDLAMHEKLGMSPAELKKRQKILAEVRALERWGSRQREPRTVLKRRPQPFLIQVGDCTVYPTAGRDCINSHYASKEKIPARKPTAGVQWS